MAKAEFGTAKTLLNYKIGRTQSQSDILVLTMAVHDAEIPFALDRRIAEHMSDALAKIAKKLSAPRHEN